MKNRYKILVLLAALAIAFIIPAGAKAEPTVERTITLTVGQSKTIGLPDNQTGGPLQGVVWASQNSSVASIDQGGTIVAVNPGSTIVYDTNSQRGVKVVVEGLPTPTPAPDAPVTGQNTGTVTNPTVNQPTGSSSTGTTVASAAQTVVKKTKIALNKKKVTLEVKSKTKLKLNGASGKVKWSSSKKKIATVTKKGVVKARKVGKAVVTAKYKNKKYKCKVTVIKKKKANKTANTTTTTTSTTVNNGPVKLSEEVVVITDKNESIQLTLLNADPGKVTWSLKYPEDDKKMSVTNGLVKIKINGTYGVVAEYEGKKYECKIYCFNLAFNNIDGLVYYSKLDPRFNESQGMSVSISGIEMAEWDKITWSNSSSSVISMEVGQGNGFVNIVPTGGGTATISATFMGKTATCTVNVKQSDATL